MNTNRIFRFILCFLMVAAATAANAHSVWIEVKNGQLVVRFAEPGEDFEKSPGYLDNLTIPIAFLVRDQKPVAVQASKQSDCFTLAQAASSNTACVESTFTVRGGRKPIFYARWQQVGVDAGTSLLTLDLVPTGKPGEVRVYFRGKPLGGIAATLRTPDEKDQEITADAEGLLHFETKQSGQYLLTLAHYREPLAGFHAGVAYTETSHNAALGWVQP
jgi:hypothetical protein